MKTTDYDSPRVEILNIGMAAASCLTGSNVDMVTVGDSYDSNDFDY